MRERRGEGRGGEGEVGGWGREWWLKSLCIITLRYNVVAEMVFVNKFKKKLWVCMFVCMYTSLYAGSSGPLPSHRPLPPPATSCPKELLSHTSNIRSFKKLLTLQSEFKMSSYHPVFSGKYYILNISLLWSLFETFNFFNLSRGIYFKNIAFYMHALKPLA